MTFLDIGAGIGSYAIPLAKKGLRVYAVEPDPVSFHLLSLNAKLNNVMEELLPINYYVSKDKGKIRIKPYVKLNFSASNVYAEVESVGLTELCENFKISPDIVKIDVDGNEVKVVESGMEILREARFVVIELRPGTSAKVDSIMRGLGKRRIFIEYTWSKGLGCLIRPRIKPSDFMALYL